MFVLYKYIYIYIDLRHSFLIYLQLSTDIPSVLAGTAFNIDESNGGFVVHWLNNKEFNFTSSVEVFMQHLRKLSEQQLEEDLDDVEVEEKEEIEEKERGLRMKLDHG